MTSNEAKNELKDAYANVCDVLQSTNLGTDANNAVRLARSNLYLALRNIY